MLTDRQIRRIVLKIREDLNDRRGLHLDSVDRETQVEILKAWSAIVRGVANTTTAPAPAVTAEEATHRERMADFGQYMFDAIEALNDPIKEGWPLVDSRLTDVTDAYIKAWLKIKRENRKLAERLREAEEIGDLFQQCTSKTNYQQMTEAKRRWFAYRKKGEAHGH